MTIAAASVRVGVWGMLRIAIGMAVLLAPTLVLAQAPRTITLPEAIQIALTQSITIKRSANTIASGEADVRGAQGNFEPSLSVSAGPTARFGRGVDGATGQLQSNSSVGFSMNASAGYTLFNGFSDIASLREAQRQLEATRQTDLRARQDLAFSVVSLFLGLAQNRELIAVATENVSAQRSLLEQIEAFVTAGTRPVSDRYNQQASLADAELRLVNANHAFDLSELQLKQALELDPRVDYNFVLPPPDTLQVPSETVNPDSLYADALSRRPEIAAAQSSIEAAKEAIRVANSTRYPTISVSAGTGTSYSSSNDQFGFGSQLFSSNPNASIGVSASLPIFDRERTAVAVERAEIGLSNQELSLQSAQKQVVLDVQRSYLDFTASVEQIRATTRQLEAARAALDAEQARYAVGVSTLFEVAQARTAFVQAQGNRLQAVYGAMLNRVAIDYNAGSIDAAAPLK